MLTVQQWQSHDGAFDFHPAQEAGMAEPEAAQRREAGESLGKGYG